MATKIFLDSFHLSTLESLAVKEGIINKVNTGEKLILSDYYSKKKLFEKSSILQTVTLYDKIEGAGTFLDFHPLRNENLIDEKSNLLTNEMHEFLTPEFQKNNIDEFNYISRLSLDYLRRYRNKVLTFPLNSEKNRFSKADVEKYGNIKINRILNGSELELRDYGIDDTVWYDQITSYIDVMLESFKIGMFFSISKGYYFTDCLISLDKRKVTFQNKVLNDINYIVRTNLTDEILFLPNPKTLKEALKMRESKEIKRFREVLGIWIDTIKSGNAKVEIKIRKDIAKANQELKTLESWRQYKESPINFWINSIGGHLPILGNVLTVVSMLGGIYEKWADKKYSWILALKKE